MNINLKIDVLEEDISQLGIQLLSKLLIDRTTKKNIIWATSDYEILGPDYGAKCHIKHSQITGVNAKLVLPRVFKAKEEQVNRTRDKAEVFTPSWVCDEQNNLVDEQWFGKKDVFNSLDGNKWISTKEKIVFPSTKGRQWKDYVDARRMEISCGEAPYLVSRYDTVTGTAIELNDRIGLLDRKLRVVNENTDNKEEWYKWALRALQSIYGYEYQGDNLLLARKNVFYTFIENAIYKYNEVPNEKILNTAARIISWNLWQMDGLKYTVPFGKLEDAYRQLSMFDIMEQDMSEEVKNLKCKIMDWRADHSVAFASLIKGENNG